MTILPEEQFVGVERKADRYMIVVQGIGGPGPAVFLWSLWDMEYSPRPILDGRRSSPSGAAHSAAEALDLYCEQVDAAAEMHQPGGAT